MEKLGISKYFIKINSYHIYKCDYKHIVPDFMINRIKYDKSFAKIIHDYEKSKYCLDTLMDLGGRELSIYLDEDLTNPLGDKYEIVYQLLKSRYIFTG